MVGPGKPIDTDRYFVICPNILGGCMGSTGPASIDPNTGKPYGLNFPVITIGDMVNAQVRLIDHLGIDQLFCVIGGSMGGMQVLEWAASHTERVFSAMPIATAAWHSSQNIAFHEVGRQAVMADPDWCGGDYHSFGKVPRNGLSVARMAAHITYLSEDALHRKFGRNLQERSKVTFSFNADFQVESYLRHQGSTFVDRFDANSYLYITRAMDYFDLAAEHGDVLANAFRGTKTRFCVVSFTSDWLYPTRESREIVHALNAVAANVSFVEIDSNNGHDAFLLEEPEFFATVRGFLSAAGVKRGLQGIRPLMQKIVSARPGRAPRRPPAHRRDGRRRARACSTSAAATARCCSSWPRPRSIDGRGVELSRERVNACVTRGLSVIQGDADRDLADYPDQAFDYAILSLTIQATRYPKTVLENLLRIGRHAIVSFPNFGHWRIRTRASVHRAHAADAATCRSPGTPARTRTCARSRTSPISSPWSMRRSRRPWRSTPPGSGCRSGTPSRCRTFSARRPCSCCASTSPPRRDALLRGFAVPSMFPAIS